MNWAATRELGSAPLIDLPLQGLSFVSGLIFNPLSILNYRPEDSGLMLFSRWLCIRGTLHIEVDDGRYDVQVTVTTWDEQF